MNRILIIYYHEIVPDGCGDSYQKLDRTRFEQQMRYLHESGYRSLLFSELDRPLPERALIVSFDDGFSSVYKNAAPIMQEYGVKGNVYLPTGRIQTEGFMSWEMVKELRESGSWFFAAHTHTHSDVRTWTEERAGEEVVGFHALFQKHLGYHPKVFCFPYGTYDRFSVRLLRRIGGYRCLLGSFYGFADFDAAERRVLPRIGIRNEDTLSVFEAKLQGKLNWKGPLQKARMVYGTLRGDRVKQDGC